jgi:hypothetical protein
MICRSAEVTTPIPCSVRRHRNITDKTNGVRIGVFHHAKRRAVQIAL